MLQTPNARWATIESLVSGQQSVTKWTSSVAEIAHDFFYADSYSLQVVQDAFATSTATRKIFLLSSGGTYPRQVNKRFMIF